MGIVFGIIFWRWGRDQLSCWSVRDFYLFIYLLNLYTTLCGLGHEIVPQSINVGV